MPGRRRVDAAGRTTAKAGGWREGRFDRPDGGERLCGPVAGRAGLAQRPKRARASAVVCRTRFGGGRRAGLDSGRVDGMGRSGRALMGEWAAARTWRCRARGRGPRLRVTSAGRGGSLGAAWTPGEGSAACAVRWGAGPRGSLSPPRALAAGRAGARGVASADEWAGHRRGTGGTLPAQTLGAGCRSAGTRRSGVRRAVGRRRRCFASAPSWGAPAQPLRCRLVRRPPGDPGACRRRARRCGEAVQEHARATSTRPDGRPTRRR
jgi:hypothetical protein